MGQLSWGIVGCGVIAPWHADSVVESQYADLVVVCDIEEEKGQEFARRYGDLRFYGDYRQMLAEGDIQVVSICTPSGLHSEMTVAAAEAGVKAVHCEKPMSTTWGDSRRMVQVCKAEGVQLTIDHQRRFGEPFRKAKELLDEGVIGDLVRLEGSCSNLYDWGTHWFDMMFMYNGDCAAKWVMAQIDCREGRAVFGVELESQGLSEILWENGVRGVLFTGRDS